LKDHWKTFSLSDVNIAHAMLTNSNIFYVDDESGSVSKAKIDEVTPDIDHPGELKEVRASFQGVTWWLIPRKERYRLVTVEGAEEFLTMRLTNKKKEVK